jgi:hypothetical protein
MSLTPEQRKAYRLADKERGKKHRNVTLTAEEYNFFPEKLRSWRKIQPVPQECCPSPDG